jgi:hypothetical protein
VNSERIATGRAKILYSDTDSIYVKVCRMKGKTKQDKFEYFLSKISPELRKRHFAEENELTVGKMKLEKLIDECVFLKPKTYALLEGSESKSFNKGVILKQNTNLLKFENYKKVLYDNNITRCKNIIIQKTSKFDGLGVSMNTLEVEKIGLDVWYDKRIMVNSIETQPYGMKATESKTPL